MSCPNCKRLEKENYELGLSLAEQRLRDDKLLELHYEKEKRHWNSVIIVSFFGMAGVFLLTWFYLAP